MKLSKTQLKVLKELAKEDIILHYMRYMGDFNPNPHWFISSSLKNVRCSTANFLIKEKLIQVTLDSLGYRNTAKITDKGRELLKEK